MKPLGSSGAGPQGACLLISLAVLLWAGPRGLAFEVTFEAAPEEASATITIGLVIPQCVFITTMWVTPRVLSMDWRPDDPPVHLRLDLPPFFQPSHLRLDTIQLNGVPLRPIRPPLGWRGNPEAGRCHLFFNRGEVVKLLGPPPGRREVHFQAEVVGGHLLTAVDTITLRDKRKEWGTWMQVTPRVLLVKSPPAFPVQICLGLPLPFQPSDVDPEIVQINGVPILPVPPPKGWQGDSPGQRSFFFDPRDFLQLLGLLLGRRTVRFQAETGDGDLITATDWITLK